MRMKALGLLALGIAGTAAVASLNETAEPPETVSVAVAASVLQKPQLSEQEPAKVDSETAAKTFLTIYPNDLAMVTEVRRINLPAGPVNLRILGVTDRIISQTAVLQSFQGVTLERNFDADLISKGQLLESAVGQSLSIRRFNPASGKTENIPATLVAAGRQPNNDTLQGAVFETPEGIEALECAGLQESVLFANLPTGLNPAPVLSLNLHSEMAGEKEITISYLTQGLGWRADYRLDVNDAHDEGALSGWLTLTNSTSKTFENVPTAIVAGNINRDHNTRAEYARSSAFTPTCWPKGSTKTGFNTALGLYDHRHDQYGNRKSNISHFAAQAPMLMERSMEMNDEIMVTGNRRQATREDLGDYKLYRTPQPVTVAAHQTKQVSFLSVDNAEIEQLYKFKLPIGVSPELRAADIEYEIDNSKDGRLAQPLPRGTVRVMMTRSNGQTAFLGEDSVRDLAVDLPVEVGIAESINVKMRSNIEGINNPNNPYLRISGDIFNAMSEPIIAEVELSGDRIRARQIGSESHTRNPEDIIPTYRIPVEGLGQESFFVELPMERIYRFDRKQVDFRSNRVGDSDRERATPLFRLKGQGGVDSWASDYFPSFSSRGVNIKSTLLDRTYIEVENKGQHVRFTELHEFSNTTNKPVKVRFDFPTNSDTVLVDASAPPASEDPLVWEFTLAARESRDLTLTFENTHIP